MQQTGIYSDESTDPLRNQYWSEYPRGILCSRKVGFHRKAANSSERMFGKRILAGIINWKRILWRSNDSGTMHWSEEAPDRFHQHRKEQWKLTFFVFDRVAVQYLLPKHNNANPGCGPVFFFPRKHIPLSGIQPFSSPQSHCFFLCTVIQCRKMLNCWGKPPCIGFWPNMPG